MIARKDPFDFWDEDEDVFGNKIDREAEFQVRAERYEKIVSFSPEMSAYRAELRRVIESLKSINALPMMFDNALLVSIDEGWGYTEFAEMIYTEIKSALGMSKAYFELVEETYPTGLGKDTWEQQYDRIHGFSKSAATRERFDLITYDLAGASKDLSNPAFKKNMAEIKRLAKDIVLVFRVPYMEKNTLAAYERALADIMSVRVVTIPPVSIENMVVYLREQLQKVNIDVEEACDDLLEQWICQEKSEGVFYGYQALDKMVSELVYQKALGARDDNSSIKKVVVEDIQKRLDNPILAENAYELLNELIGMTQLKVKVREIVAQIKLQKELEAQGKDIEKPSLHMLFLGNPGTGKTTVARIIGRIFKQEGILSKGHFIEMIGGDFVYGKVGDTMEKIRTTCRDAYGSVLFIDEAYGMSVEYNGGNITDEILPTLVAEMENHRDSMCVILAGYKDEMEEFLKNNSGLKSRIPHILEFPNYSKDELIEIFFHMVNGRFEYEEAMKESLCEYIQNISETAFDNKEFSNARFVRNLYERLWGKAAYRISLSGEEDIILKKEDMVCVIEEEDFQTMVKEKNKKPIGFR